ncbi:MAG TPA: DUF6062 family protein [Chloroflexota bacterium]|jgi:hypothetical protein
MRRPTAPEGTTAEVQHALGRAGCAVCHLTQRSVNRFLKALAYEQVNDLELRAELRASRGFCPAHAQRWLHQPGNVLGTALIYADAITAALRELSEAPASRGMLPGLFGGRSRDIACVACRYQVDAQDRYLDALLEGLGAGGLAEALARSDGLCLPHTRRGVELGGRRAEPLLARAREVAKQLLAELAEVARKEDYRFKDEPRTEAERTVPRRAVAWAAGLDGLT